MKKQNILVLVISTVLISGGLFLIFTRSAIFDCLLSLECNPVLYQLWKKIPVDIRTEIYFFNWTNPEDIHNVSAKLRFEEIGPYVYMQREERSNIVWNNNGTVTFQQRKLYFRDDSEKNGNLDAIITSIDPTMVGISYVTRTWNALVRRGVFLTLGSFFGTVHKSSRVSELLFEGYSAPLVKIARAMPMFAHLKLPPWDRFGWFYNRNGSLEMDGIFNMGTGSGSVFGKIYSWNHQNKTGYFQGKCGEVAGSAGQFFPRNLQRDHVEMFSIDLRSTLRFNFEKDNLVKSILGYEYTASNLTLDNGTLVPENKCFCAGECMPSGVLNISLTRHHSPLFASLPHFYGADPYYLEQIQGLKPEKSKHEFSVIVEPTTGIVLKADVKLQLNLLVQPVPGTRLFENVPKVYVPVVWVRQKATIPDRETILLKIILAVPAICVFVGVVMVIVGVLLLYIKMYALWKRQGTKATSEEAAMMLSHKINR